ncbi:class I SAM-dependent methyltransferase [Pseudonocardia sp. GCM10023141]|uniref:class I SAM-dependent methyltransferase n=1 Tax=Pseudonocardia sp. GCM10023141 TaxID=3252653 RepID=UPI0036132EF3
MTDPDQHTRDLAAGGGPTAWFDRLYTEAAAGTAVVPWDRGTPHPLLEPWLVELELDQRDRRALTIGCGFGEDAELLARHGFATTAFDVAPTAVEGARRRFPGSTVDYRVADLLSPPPEWRHGFDLVVEIMTVQAMPVSVRAAAIAHVRDLVAPGGTLLVIALARLVPDPGIGPPWGLAHDELNAFARDGLAAVAIRGPQEAPGVLRWRAQFHRP